MNILEFLLGDTQLSVFLSTLLLVMLGVVVGHALKLVLQLFSDKITKKTRSSLDDLLVNTLARQSTMLVTVVVTYVMVITPNAEIVKSQIKNFSYPNDIVRFDVAFGVAYGTNLDEMRRIVLERINREADIVEPETSEVRILEMADSSMNAKLLCKIRNPNNIPRRKSDLLLMIYNTLYEHRIEIPFPQRVLHLAPEAREAMRPVGDEQRPVGDEQRPVGEGQGGEPSRNEEGQDV
ncbi:MAG: mechanosensitive ion channel [Bacteroidetes bacterium]|nr:mechanosensitive ion channel [Bacteroidota bacterium]